MSEVRAAGYDEFRIGAHSVTVFPRLRTWSALNGLTVVWTNIGFSDSATAYNAAQATTTKRQNEHDGLVHILTQAAGLMAEGPEFTDGAEVLTGLLAMLANIQASMAE